MGTGVCRDANGIRERSNWENADKSITEKNKMEFKEEIIGPGMNK